MIKNFKLFNYIKNNFSVIKNNNKEFSISHTPILETQETNSYDHINYSKFKKHIDKFIELIGCKLPSVNLETFFYNLKTLKIKEKKNFNNFIFFNTNTKGQYYIYDNEVSIIKDKPQAIYHELLHCASTKKSNDKIFSGFSQSIKGFGVGTGLNEGYTSLLEHRIFNTIGTTNSYTIEKIIAEAVEIVVGEEIMVNLYFESDLYNLIKELNKYNDLNNILQFLFYLDEVILYTTNTKNIKNIEEKFEYISSFLIECYIKKLYDLYENNKITFTNLQDEMEEYLNYLDIEFTIKNKHFTLITHKIIDEVLKEYNLEAYVSDDEKVNSL